ncbi:MAG: EscU/YscU/HrcU family type III secretion system export apparatus switch protein [Bdellovibrionales bacterium]
MEEKSPFRTRKAVAIGAPPPESPVRLPHLIAAGRGELAEHLLTIAFENNIRVREDADLTELLTTLHLDTPIPPQAIMAVAEILTRVYQLNNELPPDYVNTR